MIKEVQEIVKFNQDKLNNSLTMIDELRAIRFKYNSHSYHYEKQGDKQIYYLDDDRIPLKEDATAKFMRFTLNEIKDILPLRFDGATHYFDKSKYHVKFSELSEFLYYIEGLTTAQIFKDFKKDLINYHTQKAEYFFKNNTLTILNISALHHYGFIKFKRLLLTINLLKFNKLLTKKYYENIWALIQKQQKIRTLKTDFKLYKNGKMEVTFHDKILLKQLKEVLN